MKRNTPLKRTAWGTRKKPLGGSTRPKAKKKKESIGKVKKEADAVFSRFIRARDKGQCFTCPKKDDPKYMQCGHFNPRQYLATRYDEKNNNCQCYACNMLYGGQPATYSVRLTQKYGLGIVEELEKKRWEVTKYDIPFYKGIIQIYTDKLSQLVV